MKLIDCCLVKLNKLFVYDNFNDHFKDSINFLFF